MCSVGCEALGVGFPGLALTTLMLPVVRSPPMNSLPPRLCLAVFGVGGPPKGECGDAGDSLEAGAPKVKSGRVAVAVCGRGAGDGGDRVTLRFLTARRWFSDDQPGDGRPGEED